MAAPASEPAATSEEKPNGTTLAHGIRKLRNLDVPVFVDGKQKAVLRYGELPPQVQGIVKASDEIKSPRNYRVSDYLAAIGVDVARVKRVDFADMRNKIASVTGAELRADKDRFVVAFLQDTGGAVQVNWDTTRLANELRIFDIYAVNVFVDVKPWAMDKTLHCYPEEGECKPVARFSSEDVMKGTRVYADGKLVSYVKRRLLADGVTTGTKTGEGEAVFSLDKYLSSIGIDAAKAKTVQLLAGDAVVAKADAAAWSADREKLTFALVRHSHGKVTATVPADLQAPADKPADRQVQVTAIEVFSKVDARTLPFVAIDDVPDLTPLEEQAKRDGTTAQVGADGHDRDRPE